MPVAELVGELVASLDPESVGEAVDVAEADEVGVPVAVPVADTVGVAVGDVPLGDAVGDDVAVPLAVGEVGTAVALAAQLGAGVLEEDGRVDGRGLGPAEPDVEAAVRLALFPGKEWSICAVEATAFAGPQLVVGVGAADDGPRSGTALGASTVLACPSGAVAPCDGTPPVPIGVPWPSVPAPPAGCAPPVSTVLLAWMMACLTGWTPTVTIAIIPTPASTTTGRSQRTAPSGWAARRRNSGQGTSHAQCPRQVQFRARLTAPATTLNSQGEGLRSPILARIRSSPSVPGSTWLSTATRACRSALSRLSSGEVMPSPASVPGHSASCVRMDLSAAIARAV